MKTNRPAFRIGCLILAAAALTVSPSFAQTQEPAGATATAAVISSVAITQASQRASVRVEGEGPLEVRASRMQNPERLVLDFSGARLAVQKTPLFPAFRRRCAACAWASTGPTWHASSSI